MLNPAQLPSGSVLEWLVLELRSLTEALKRAERGRHAVMSLSSALPKFRDAKSLCQGLLEELRTLVHADNGSVMLLDRDGNHLVIVADIDLPPDVERTRLPLTGSTCAAVIASGEPMLLRWRLSARGRAQRGLRCSMVVPVVCSGRTVGVVNLNAVSESHSFDDVDLELATTAAATFGATLEALEAEEARRTLMVATIRALAQTIEAKDPYTRGHCERVRALSTLLAERHGLPTEVVRDIEIGATLHDIGKVGIPESILLKPGRLTPAEFDVVRRHPEIAMEILSPVGLSQTTLESVRSHHERVDGTGYPDGLKGEAIPIAGRILAVADTVDSMTSARPYRNPQPMTAVMDELTRCSGSQFDPNIVRLFQSASLDTPAIV